jgi:DNA-binding LacI/PurR family transcriptional regulator
MALLAVELVLKRLAEPADGERPPATLRFSGHLIVRGSTAPAQ